MATRRQFAALSAWLLQPDRYRGLTAADAGPLSLNADGVTVLLGAEAHIRGNLREADIGRGKRGWVEGWSGSEDSLTWKLIAPRSDEYLVNAIATGGTGRSFEVEVAGTKLSSSTGDRWERLPLGSVGLPAGGTTVTLRPSGNLALNKFFALELVRPSVAQTLQERAHLRRASTDLLIAGRYGLMFHWSSQSMPRRGPPKSYQQAVHDFDVPRFSDMVEQMGAGHVIFTTSHAEFYFPGPSAVIDRILPGRTCDRDLVVDLAAGLNERNIRLMLYHNPGHDDDAWWQRTHYQQNKSKYFDQWCEIVADIGNRYRERLFGFWFDDALFTYYPYNAPWERMTDAAKSGYPNRLVMYNSWILPKATDFQEVFCGESDFSQGIIEGYGRLPVGGTGKFSGGPQEGLQGHITTFLEGSWGHFKRNTPIGPPQFSTETMIAKIRDCISRKNVPTIDAEIYQDGTISPATFQQFVDIRRSIKSARRTGLK